MVYRKINKCIPRLLEELSKKDNIFFRFHDPNRRMSSRSKSWGMIYTSEREAITDGSTVLEGKSCMPTAEQLMEWKDCFDDDYVVIAFYGCDTRETGHDGEYVATYIKKAAVFNYKDFCNCFTYKEIELGVSGWVLNVE